MLEKLKGSRTKIQAALLALVGAYMAIDDLLNSLGLINLPDPPTWLIAILGGGIAYTLRDAINNK